MSNILFLIIACDRNLTTSLSHSVIDGEESPSSQVFSPLDYDSLEVWLDANDSTTLFQSSSCLTPALNQGDDVQCWLDKSGQGNHATMSVALQNPTLNLLDNIGSVEFDGIDDHFDNAHSFNSRTVFIIYKMDSGLQQATDLAQLWGQYSAGHLAPDARSVGFWSFDGNVSQQAIYSMSGNTYSPTTTGSSFYSWVYDQFDLVAAEFTNDVAITRQVIGSLTPTFSVGVHQFGGQISEILVYSDTLTTLEHQKIEGYLACKWGLQTNLPSLHPYKVICP